MKNIALTILVCLLCVAVNAQNKHRGVAPPQRPAHKAVRSRVLTPQQRSVGRMPLPPSPPPPPLAPHP